MKEVRTVTIITGPFGCIPPHAIGAVERLWFQIGSQWEKGGISVHYISKRPSADDKRANVTFVKGYERTGNIVWDIILDFIFSFKALLKVSKTDVLVLNTFFSPILFPFFKRQVRLSVYNVARFPKRQFFLYRGMGLLSCVSASVYRELIRQSPWAITQAKVIHNPIDTHIFTPQGTNAWSDEIKVVYAGRIHKEKGLDILVRAINCLRQTHPVSLKMIGPIDIEKGGSGEVYVHYLNSLCRGWNIEWRGPMSDSISLAKELSKSNIFCYPSVAERGETFGVAPLEAMGLGLVPVVSALDCFSEFVEQGVNGQIFEHRENAVENLVSAMTKIIDDRKMFESMSKAAVDTSRKFSVEKVAEDYLNTFFEKLK